MKIDIKAALTKNIGLKILSLVLASLLWLLVVNIDDPSQTKTFTAVVNVINEDALSKAGKYYTINEGRNTVTFRVTAKRSVIEKLSGADFVATADMNYLEGDVRIPVDVSCSVNGVSISAKQLYLYINVAEQESSRLIVSGHVIGDPVEGYAVKDVTVSPNVITVTGPAERVDKIASVEAYVDITDLASDITESVVPTFYDENGESVDMTGLEVSAETVSVSVDVVMLKTVDVNVKPGGELPEGLELESITVDPYKVMIMGEAEDINGIVAIVIPDTVINLSDIHYNFSTVVDISAYLPEGAYLVDGAASLVTVSVNLVGESSADFVIPTGMLSVHNLAENCIASIEENSVSLSVTSSDDNMALINGTQLSGYVDLNGLGVGTYQVPVKLKLNDEYNYSNVTVTVSIKSNEKKPSTEGEGDNSSDESKDDSETTGNQNTKPDENSTEDVKTDTTN